MRINLPAIIATGLLGMSFLSGCASFHDYSYEQKQRLRASAQFRECGKANCSQYPLDYKRGWKDGFYAVATGDSCCPPAIAPSCYWDPKQILDDCDNRRHAYYSGWQDGAARASQFPDTHYLRVYETCECPFPRCEECCPTDACGYPSSALLMDEGLVETEIPMVDVAMPIAPIPEPMVNESVDDSEPAPTTAEASRDVTPMPAPKVEKSEAGEDLPPPASVNQPTPGSEESATQYNFLENGGVVIDFPLEGETGSPSDVSGGNIVTGTVADLDFTFEHADGFGLIESDLD